MRFRCIRNIVVFILVNLTLVAAYFLILRISNGPPVEVETWNCVLTDKFINKSSTIFGEKEEYVVTAKSDNLYLMFPVSKEVYDILLIGDKVTTTIKPTIINSVSYELERNKR